MPLRGIPRIISPDLLKILAEMGHGDEICLADCNFPAASIAEAQAKPRLVYDLSADNVTLLRAILQLMPLDQYVDQPAAIMRRVPSDEASNLNVAIWSEFESALAAANGGQAVQIEQVERFAFYERAKKCFAVVQTGERRQYGNIILKKGVLRADE